MHDIPTTQGEADEINGQTHEYSSEMNGEHDIPNPNYEFANELGEADELAFNEMEESELAAEFLEIRSDQELDQFLGKLVRRAARGVKKFARSSIGKAIGGALRGVAKVGLPFAAGAVGTMFGGPLGGMIGRKLGSMVSSRLEIDQELQEMSPEDREFEVARRFVRVGGAATRAAMRHRVNLRGRRDAIRLVSRITQQHAPIWSRMVKDGLRQRRRRPGGRIRHGAITMGTGTGGFASIADAPRAGQWYRRGRAVVIVVS